MIRSGAPLKVWAPATETQKVRNAPVLCRGAVSVVTVLGLSAAVAVGAAQASDGPAPGDKTTRIARQISQAAPGATVRLPAGTVVLRRPLDVPRGVTIEGDPRGTVLRLDPAAADLFSYSFMIRPAGSGATGVRVRNLTLDGSNSEGVPDNTGGGIKVGSGWRVSGVHFSDLSYFKLWIRSVREVTATGNVFDGALGRSGGNDNIGGGRSADIRIVGNTIAAGARGNAIDLVNSDRVQIRDNVIVGTPAIEHSVFLEGGRKSVIDGNSLTNSSITVQSDVDYGDRSRTHNPAVTTVSDNSVTGAPGHGIALKYEGSSRALLPGGGNQITGNRVVDSGRTGIVLLNCHEGSAAGSDVIADNLVVNPFADGEAQWNTGCGTVPASGIAVTGGSARLVDNEVADDRSRPVTMWGLFLGAAQSPVPLGSVVQSGNSATGTTAGLTNRP